MYYPTVTSECGMNFAPTKIETRRGASPRRRRTQPRTGRLEHRRSFRRDLSHSRALELEHPRRIAFWLAPSFVHPEPQSRIASRSHRSNWDTPELILLWP